MEMKSASMRSQILMVVSWGSLALASCGDLAGDAGLAQEAASSKTYSFALLAAQNGAAPGGGTYAFDFEPGGLNSSSRFSYAADVSTGGEGVFLGWPQDRLAAIFSRLRATPDGPPFELQQLG